MVVDAQALDHLKPLLKNSRNNIGYEAVLILSNITVEDTSIQRSSMPICWKPFVKCYKLTKSELRNAALMVANIALSSIEQHSIDLLGNNDTLRAYSELMMTSSDVFITNIFTKISANRNGN